MRQFFRISVFIIFLMAYACTGVQCKTIRMTTCNWQPYAGVNLTSLGFSSDLLTILFKRLGHDTKIDILPWKRSMLKTKIGDYDLAYNAYYSEQRTGEYAFTDPYIHSSVYLCSRKKDDISFITLEELTLYKIGVVMGYVNSEAFDRAEYLTKDEAVNDLQNLKKLVGKRVDLIVIDKYVAVQAVKTSPFLIANVTDLVFHEPPLATRSVHAAFSRAVPGYRERVEAFNRELKKMIQDGTYDTLLEVHNFK